MDLTIAQIAAKLTDETLKAWLLALPALPQGITPVEFASKFLQAGFLAQVAYNADKAAGQRLNSYNFFRYRI